MALLASVNNYSSAYTRVYDIVYASSRRGGYLVGQDPTARSQLRLRRSRSAETGARSFPGIRECRVGGRNDGSLKMHRGRNDGSLKN